MKTIGIKLADGSFYPVLDEGKPSQKSLDLTTAHNNQTKIMVDLYRSANCTMDDAEYVDSLQIENLIEHPNGEPDITFQVSIDENNELSAKIVDKETGEQSKTTITLVSRTMEERLHTDDYNISDTIVEDSEEKQNSDKNTDDNKVAKTAAIGGMGLLAAASAIREKEKNNQDFSEDDFTLGEPDANKEEPLTTEEIEFAPIPDFEEDKTEIEEPTVEENTSEDSLSPDNSDDTVVQDDFNLNDTFGTDDFKLQEDDSADETLSSGNSDDTVVQDDFNLDDNLGSDDFKLPEDDSADETLSSDNSDDTVVQDDFNLDDNNEEDPLSDESSLTDFDFNLPNDDFGKESGESDESAETQIDDSFDLPDFSENSENEETQINKDDLFKDTDDTATTPMGNGLSFTGLYDTETELGEPGKHSEDEAEKKTKVPVIICITCAIICIIATLLVLFIIPSKYNLINKKNTKTEEVIEPPVEEVKVPEEIQIPEETIVEEIPESVPQAKEDEIIVIEEAEEVEPLPPPVKEEKKPESIKYKIKWGDTLWDICDTYYKNPWKYKYLARWNGITNPDHIISGTYIIIPAE